jgi:hypothetical protein
MSTNRRRQATSQEEYLVSATRERTAIAHDAHDAHNSNFSSLCYSDPVHTSDDVDPKEVQLSSFNRKTAKQERGPKRRSPLLKPKSIKKIEPIV